MATIFSVADDEIQGRLRQVLGRHHPLLVKYDVAVLAIGAENYKTDALTSGGFPCTATARVVPDRDHCTKRHQAEITIDLMRWATLTPSQKDALLDHELCHIDLDYDDDSGKPKRDSLRRVRVKLRKADFQPSDGFLEVIERHGKDAPEWRSLSHVGTLAGEALARRPTLFDTVPPDEASEATEGDE